MADSKVAHGETWIRVNDQEWAIMMFIRQYLAQFKSPPRFFDVDMKVRGPKVTGRLPPDSRMEFDLEHDMVVIDGSSRRIIRDTIAIEGQTAALTSNL